MIFKTKICSSLEKVFPNETPKECTPSATALGGEYVAFQLAYWCDVKADFSLKVKSTLKTSINLRKVTLVPMDFLAPNLDDDALKTEPALAPDLLQPLPGPGNTILTAPKQWCSIWLSLKVPEKQKGLFDIVLSFEDFNIYSGEKVENPPEPAVFSLNVLPCSLPPQTLKVTRWFHSDCLASFYGCKIFSAKHWKIIEHFVKNAVEHGQTMLLTPIFTPPLDTQVGTYRPAVQLVDITQNGNAYSFDFSKLERWVNMALRCGIRQFEMAHLFTQWGAKCTPQIWAKTPNGFKRIFGWDVPADSPEYETFLAAFLPQLCIKLQQLNIADNVVFHCSDEPHKDNLQNYKSRQKLIRKYLPPQFHIMDALSHADFCNESMVDIPVPIESAWMDFAKLPLKEKWTYYCCGPSTVCPNQFIYMPSARNRILGMILYRHGIQGFLHWGFNFYYSIISRYPINPFLTTSGDMAYPSGDAFLVYPGSNGFPLDSIRHEVFREGLQDYRMLQLLETKIGKEKINAILDKASGGLMTFHTYPKTEKQVLALRTKLNKLLQEHC